MHSAQSDARSDEVENSSSVVEEPKMAQSAPTKLLVNWMLNETVEISHHD
jgi:hypothetical protein